ncbi:hypothetical protein FRUB_05278 [Fimbriiglobus ruber]|uniref:Uncharacterized protein n=2 Tax=Fimbriiglobus ruber TaxID=1908690 RepID=A0A225DT57_9BACT|nr:hypothetical protein FRUB_05278 [Fimbriiglobus ruber]
MTLVALGAVVAVGAAGKPDFLVDDPGREAESLRSLPVKSHQADLSYLRAAVKSDITWDVIADRRSLLEAAALFRSLNAIPGTLKTNPPEPPPGPFSGTDEGRLCWHVVRAVDILLNQLPDESSDSAEAIVTHLVAEFEGFITATAR